VETRDGGDSGGRAAQDTFSGRNHGEDAVTNPELVGIAALLLRLSLAVMFYAHAWVKIKVFTPAGTVKYFESLGVPGWFAYATMAAEIGGGTLLLLGIETRWVALLLVPLILGTIVLVHGKNGWMFTNKDGGWEFPAFWTVGLLVLALLGDGSAALGPMIGL
jgi:putative oxidoreductase